MAPGSGSWPLFFFCPSRWPSWEAFLMGRLLRPGIFCPLPHMGLTPSTGKEVSDCLLLRFHISLRRNHSQSGLSIKQKKDMFLGRGKSNIGGSAGAELAGAGTHMFLRQDAVFELCDQTASCVHILLNGRDWGKRVGGKNP